MNPSVFKQDTNNDTIAAFPSNDDFRLTEIITERDGKSQNSSNIPSENVSQSLSQSLSQTLSQNSAELPLLKTGMGANDNNNNDNKSASLFKKDIYISQFDSDIAWYSAFGMNNFDGATPMSLTMENADFVGKKITNLAIEKGAITSTFDNTKTSYPILGYVVFTVRFDTEEPKIRTIDTIDRQAFVTLLQNKSNQYDVTSYIPNWIEGGAKRRYVLHQKAFRKLKLVHIKMVKTINIDQHQAFCFYNMLANSGRMKIDHIQLIKELLSNGDGKSFLKPTDLQSTPDDKFYGAYMKYKTIYLQNKLNR